MLEKISIIAGLEKQGQAVYNGIEDLMLTIGWWQNYQSQLNIFDPPNGYIISKNTSGAEC